MHVRNLTIRGTGFAKFTCDPRRDQFLNAAGGSVTNVTVLGMTRNNGCAPATGIQANALAGPARP